MPRLLAAIAATLLLSGSTGCASDGDKGATDSAAKAAWFDTGIEAAPGDATWEAEDDATTELSDDGAEAGYDGLRPVRPEVASDLEDNVYRAGEVIYVAFDLHNTGDADYHHHPGLVLSSDHPDVEIPDAEQWVSSLQAGDSASMTWWAVVGPTVCSGDEVGFTATVSAHGCEDSDTGCPVAHTASITVHIE